MPGGLSVALNFASEFVDLVAPVCDARRMNAFAFFFLQHLFALPERNGPVCHFKGGIAPTLTR
jgi:hypothetical protein